MRPAQAAGDRQRIGQLEDVVREERIILAVLVITRILVAEVVERRQRAEAVEQGGTNRRGEYGIACGAQAAGCRRIAQGRRRVDRRDDAARRKGAVLGTELQVIADHQVFVRIIAADQPVEAIIEERTLEAQFLGEGVELAERAAVVGAIADVDIAIVDVRRIAGPIFAIGGDRRQRRIAEIVVDLHRPAVILRHVRIGAAGGVRDLAVVRIACAGEDAAQATQNINDAIAVRIDRIVARHAGRRIQLLAQVDVDGAAALLVTPGIVAKQADREITGRFEQQLAAHEPAVAVIIVGIIHDIVEEAVPLVEDAVEPKGEHVLYDRARDGAGDADVVVVAVGALDIAAEIIVRHLRVDVDRAGRGIAARQRALRATQHFDPVDFADVVETRAGTAAIDAVDEYRNRAFQAGIVADGADAADARGGIGLAAGGRNLQRRCELRDAANVGCARVLQRRLADGRYGDRHVGEPLRATGRGYDNIPGAKLIGAGRSIGGGRFLWLGNGTGRDRIGARLLLRHRRQGDEDRGSG